MIEKFTKAWFDNINNTRAYFEAARNAPSYDDIVKYCISMIASHAESKFDFDDNIPDPERIIVINHGDYQGTIVYVIASKGYQPSTYWSVAISYGSCSGCDTLEAINFRWLLNSTDKQPEDAVKEGMQLALHVVQKLKLIHSYELDN